MSEGVMMETLGNNSVLAKEIGVSSGDAKVQDRQEYQTDDQFLDVVHALEITTDPLALIEPTVEEVDLVLSSKELLTNALRQESTAQQALAAIRKLTRVRTQKQPYANEFRALLMDLVQDNLDVIESGISASDIEGSHVRLCLVRATLMHGEGGNKDIAIAIYGRHSDVIKAGFFNDVWCRRYDSLILDLLRSSDLVVLRDLISFFIETFQETQGNAHRESIRHIISLLNHAEPSIHEKAKTFINDFLHKYNLSMESFFEAWKRAGADVPTIQRNILSIHDLESREPGSTELLAREFGIANFARYPKEMLVAQARSIDDKERPYGVIIYPYADYNRAFYQNEDAFRGLYSQLIDTHGIRVVECESKQDIARALIRLDRAYGDTQKISFAVIGGHGNENSIHFGEGEGERYAIYAEDLEGKGLQRSTKFFVEQPKIILVSCSTGAELGVGQQLSRTLNARVFAPEVPTNLKKIDVAINQDGTFDFDVTYEEEGAEKQYEAGKLLNRAGDGMAENNTQ